MAAEGDFLVTVRPAAMMWFEIKQTQVKRLDGIALHFKDTAQRCGLPRISWQGWIAFGSRRILWRRLGGGGNSHPLAPSDHGIARERNIKPLIDRLSALAIGKPISDECAQGLGLCVRPDYKMPHVPQSPVQLALISFFNCRVMRSLSSNSNSIRRMLRGFS